MTAPNRRLEHLVKEQCKDKNSDGGNRDHIPTPFFMLSCGLVVLAGIGWSGYAVKSGFLNRDSPSETSGVKPGLRIAANFGSADVVYHPEPKKIYPPLSSKEGSELDSLVGNSKAVQEFIAHKTNYSFDEEQFGGSLCAKGSGCDVWVPAAHFYRAKIGDCDDVLAFAHYLLRDGVGIYLESFDDQKTLSHTVYLYRQHGKYGIVSIHQIEHTEAIFNSIDEAANSVRYSYDYYRVLGLPGNAEKLLYGFDIKKDVARGQKVYFPEKEGDKK